LNLFSSNKTLFIVNQRLAWLLWFSIANRHCISLKERGPFRAEFVYRDALRTAPPKSNLTPERIRL